MKIPVFLPSVDIDFDKFEDKVKTEILSKMLEEKLYTHEWRMKFNEMVQEAAQEMIRDIPKAFWALPSIPNPTTT